MREYLTRMNRRTLTKVLIGLSCLAFLGVLTLWVIQILRHGYLQNPRFLRIHLLYWLTGALLAGITFAWLARMVRQAGSKEKTLVEANRELVETQGRIKQLICLAEERQSFGFRFENPNLVNCYEVMKCGRVECPLHGKGPARCWQIVGTHCHDRQNASLSDKMRSCPNCIVYRVACPDTFTELAEDFNNLMTMLQKKAEELAGARRQAAIADKRAIAGLAHEVNNPLYGLKNCITRIQKNPGNTAQTMQYLELMMEALKRIERVMAQLLDLTRERPYRFMKANVNSILDSTLNLLSMKGQNNGVAIKSEYTASLPEIEADVPSLQQVFLNLELNALAAMPDGGTLSIRTSPADLPGDGKKYVRVEISDTGKGIPPENLERVFKPFFTTKEPGCGTGLGLSISRNIVEEHSGGMWADSEVGKGTTFSVLLPLRQT
jgi:nitrogen-specific signal transduction histidine kinase